MIQNIEYGDWVYLKSNFEIAYKVIDDTKNKCKVRICDIKEHTLYEAIDNLILITDSIKIQELESAWEVLQNIDSGYLSNLDI